MWSRALPDNGVERIGERAARAAVEAADVPKVAGLLEEVFDEVHVAPVVELLPDRYRLRREAAVSMLPHPTNAPGSGSG